MKTLDYFSVKYGVDISQSHIEIPNVGRLDLIRWIRELEFTRGLEVGVAYGEFSKLLVEGNPQMKLYGVDPYVGYRGYGDYVRESTFNNMMGHAHHVLDPYVDKDRFEFVRKYSMDAIEDFENNTLDFVYIDGNHQAPYVGQDITAWWKKVSPGGILAGHDYSRIKRVNWGVKEAVHQHAKDNALPIFILGTNAVLPNQVRDGTRSWMFIK